MINSDYFNNPQFLKEKEQHVLQLSTTFIRLYPFSNQKAHFLQVPM